MDCLSSGLYGLELIFAFNDLIPQGRSLTGRSEPELTGFYLMLRHDLRLSMFLFCFFLRIHYLQLCLRVSLQSRSSCGFLCPIYKLSIIYA
jgi:hypothetical protein